MDHHHDNQAFSHDVLSNNNRNSGSLTQNGHQRQDNNNSLPTISSSLEHHPKLDKEYSPSKDSGIQISGSSSGKGSVESVDDSRQLPNLQRKPSLTSLESRGQWGSKWEFLLSCVGLSVGIGNVWRFPYLAYENGGGAFLIPYLIMLFLAGKPMYFMELALGQFAGMGPLSIWKCSPIMKGVGAAAVAGSIVVCIYYNVVMSYSLYYMYQTFQSVLPWTRCDLDWAKGTNCVVRSANVTFTGDVKSSSQVFWERKVLDITDGIDDLGGIKWDLALALFVSWVIVLACLAKGVKTSGKVVYFAATFPYFVLLTLLIAGFTQTGAWEGVKYFLYPDFSKLWTIAVWQAAAGQMFFSLSIAMGGLIMFSSYNDFRHNIYQDAMVVSVLDTATSLISGLVIFSVLGAMSHELGVPVKDVVKGGPGLAFVAYPEALSRLPCPHLWSILFFFMLFLLGLDSEFAMLENILTSISDEFPTMRRHKLKFTLGTGTLFFLIGLVCVTRGGQYVFEIMDYYGGSIPLVFIAVFECIGLMWIYGYDNFAFDVYYMLERKMGIYWKITWKYTAPAVLAFICVGSLYNHRPLHYGDYDFPEWADVLGWVLTIIIIGQIPLWALYAFIKQKKGETLKERIVLAAGEADGWGPRDDAIRRDWRTKRTGLYGINIIAKGSDLENHGLSLNSKEPATLKRFSRILPTHGPSIVLGSPNAAVDNKAFENDSV